MAIINWGNVSDLGQVPALANEVGPFWSGILWMLWVIMLLFMAGFGFEVTLLVSSFFCLVIGLLLAYAGLVAWYHVGMFAAIILFMFLYIAYTSSKR